MSSEYAASKNKHFDCTKTLGLKTLAVTVVQQLGGCGRRPRASTAPTREHSFSSLLFDEKQSKLPRTILLVKPAAYKGAPC